MEKKWMYYSPTFECDEFNREMLAQSPWVGHRRFAYDFVSWFEPNTIVELGSYYGCSAFAFMQAIKDQGLRTSFYGVDTWQGDAFTKSDYQEDVFGAYQSVQESCYPLLNSKMLRTTFDCAYEKFQDGQIDLLHIDGSHAYEDVKHDYELWKSRVAPSGVIFFHDIASDLLYGQVMGSHVFWEELKRQEPFTLEMSFSNGLGILFCSEEQYRFVKNNVDFNAYQEYVNLQDTVNKDKIRKDYFVIRDLQRYNCGLREQIDTLNGCLRRNADELSGKTEYLERLEREKEELKAFAAQKERYAEELEEQNCQLNTFAQSKDCYAQELEGQRERLNSFAVEKEKYIQELEQQRAERTAYERALEKDCAAARKFAQEQKDYAKLAADEKAQLESFAAEKQRYIDELEGQLVSLKDYAEGKAHYVEELEGQLASLRDYAEGKAHYAEELEGQLASLRDYAEGKARYAEELEGKISLLEKDLVELRVENRQVIAEKQNAEQLYAMLCAYIRTVPFGKKVLSQWERKRREQNEAE